MENRTAKANVALIEKCVMSSLGIKSLFNAFPDCPFKLHVFPAQSAFQNAILQIPFTAAIFSLSAVREDRRVGLASIAELAVNFPHIRRLVIADDDMKAHLISSLSPSPLDGIVSKNLSLEEFQEKLLSLLLTHRQLPGAQPTQSTAGQGRMLSPTEREILRFMSHGYSMPDIAVRLQRNIKTIRAHKFNVMTKLGVTSDAGLLDAADILLSFRTCDAGCLRHNA
ncbi:TPA: DNA-binding transcriptional activator BglJ [Citrobacter freundii]